MSTGRLSVAEPGGLTPHEEAFLAAHAGVPRADGQELAQLAARTTARAEAERAASLTTAHAAERIGLSIGELASLAAAGGLLVVDHDDVPRVPSWQLTGDRLLPGLTQVLAAMAEDGPVSAVIASSFMNTPSTDLIDDPDAAAIAVSPAAWLASGRALEPVLMLARTYGEQV